MRVRQTLDFTACITDVDGYSFWDCGTVSTTGHQLLTRGTRYRYAFRGMRRLETSPYSLQGPCGLHSYYCLRFYTFLKNFLTLLGIMLITEREKFIVRLLKYVSKE